MRAFIGNRLRSGLNASLLVSSNYLSPLVTFSRSQVSSFSTAFDAAGDLVECGADVPRFNGAARRLMLEGQETNLDQNARGEGFTSGTPGVPPTGWAIPSGTLTREIIGAATVNGVPGILVRFFGTPNATGPQSIAFSANETVSAGTVVAVSAFCQLVAGSLTNVSGFVLRVSTESGGTNFTPSTTLTKYTNVRTLVGTTSRTELRWNYIDTVTAVDFTLFVGSPQRRHSAAFIGSDILPPIGTPGATTRGQDNATAAFSTLFPSGVGTVLASFMLPQVSDAVTPQTLFEIHDSTANNRFMLRNTAGGSVLAATRVNAGAAATTGTLGNVTPGAIIRVGLTFDGTSIVSNVDGGTNLTLTSQPSGLTTLRLGNNFNDTSPMFGECGYFEALPNVLSAAQLPAAVAAIL